MSELSHLRRLLARLSAFWRPARAERELAREIDAHLTLLEDEYRRRGLGIEAARAAARRQIGGIERVKEAQRHARSFAWLEETRRDVRHAWRSLLRTPGFLLVATLTMALGIGSAVTVFSVVHAVALEPLRADRPDELVTPVEVVAPDGSAAGAPLRRVAGGLSVGDLDEIRHRTVTLSHIAAYANAFMTLSESGTTARLEGWRVEPSWFQMLGVRPLLGRAFDASEAAPGASAVIVLSQAVWRRHLGGRADAIGRSVTLDERRYLVVGVMPTNFEFPLESSGRDFWVPLSLDVSTASGRDMRLPTIARLVSGVSPQRAAEEMQRLLQAKNGTRSGYELMSVHEELVRPIRRALGASVVAVGLVFVIALVNVSSLLLARTSGRQREIAIRAALGGGRSRLVRWLLTESVLVALVGSLGGVVLAYLSVRVLRALAATLPRIDLGMSTAFPRLDEIAVDAPVLAFAILLALATGIGCGLGPAVRYLRTDDSTALGRSAGTTASRTSTWLGTRDLLVVAQVALATVLLVGGGLLGRSFLTLASVNVGYDPHRVLTFQVALPSGRYQGPSLEAFAEGLIQRLRVVRGVSSAAYTPLLPMVTLLEHRAQLRRTPGVPAGQPPADDDLRGVSHDYFAVMGIPVLQGRGLSADDRAGRPLVVVINRTMARRHFPGEDPIGRSVYLQRSTDPWEVIGVVEDVRQLGPAEDAKPQAFVDSRQWPGMAPGLRFLQYFAIRIDENTASETVLPGIRDAVRALDADAAVYNVAPMPSLLSNAVSRPRLYAALATGLSGMALLIAAAGLFGTVAYFVAARTREIGIRVALGARRAQIMSLVLRRSALITGLGISIGTGGALLVTEYLESLLFGLSSLDRVTFLSVALAFAGIAMLATVLPARRALSIDPVAALRHE